MGGTKFGGPSSPEGKTTKRDYFGPPTIRKKNPQTPPRGKPQLCIPQRKRKGSHNFGEILREKLFWKRKKRGEHPECIQSG